MDAGTKALLELHERRFADAVATGDCTGLVELFADDAELAFVGVPVGPFVGRDAIAAAYADRPPDDALHVLSIDEEPDGTIVERFAWNAGGYGMMRLTLDNGLIGMLVVSFD